MSNENTGGPAFPPMHDPETHPSGLTIRDYFAAKAMQAIYLPEITDDQLAAYAYAMADAMLKERAK